MVTDNPTLEIKIHMQILLCIRLPLNTELNLPNSTYKLQYSLLYPMGYMHEGYGFGR